MLFANLEEASPHELRASELRLRAGAVHNSHALQRQAVLLAHFRSRLGMRQLDDAHARIAQRTRQNLQFAERERHERPRL